MREKESNRQRRNFKTFLCVHTHTQRPPILLKRLFGTITDVRYRMSRSELSIAVSLLKIMRGDDDGGGGGGGTVHMMPGTETARRQWLVARIC